ncbi:hypothetical protein NDU88_004375 [Pleurodeles waltl]|uniref:Uncharacterized protein n=1 Tax=Pleurodeles waltl TaxID=8319 RepID=A0AAV7RLD4_PLEWA|nr:hypothetical protein NDU88_004375 [Pleurodeles waltl]
MLLTQLGSPISEWTAGDCHSHPAAGPGLWSTAADKKIPPFVRKNDLPSACVEVGYQLGNYYGMVTRASALLVACLWIHKSSMVPQNVDIRTLWFFRSRDWGGSMQLDLRILNFS